MTAGVAPMAPKKNGNESYTELDLRLCQAIYVVIRAFFKYLVCNVTNPVYQQKDYGRFFRYSLRFFVDRFGLYRNYFSAVYKILRAKQARMDKADMSSPEFVIVSSSQPN